jgi:hypothetical protein
MKVSEVGISDLKGYANVYHDIDDSLFTAILAAAKQFLVSYTGIPLEDVPATDTEPVINGLDHYEDMTVALFILSNEMYDNRMVHVESNKIGFVIRQLLDSHSTNLL